MNTYEGTYKDNDGKDYYYLGITTKGEKLAFKNFSCLADVRKCIEKNALSLITFQFIGTDLNDLSRMPKKYQKYIN